MSQSFLIEERQFMFFSKLQRTDNIVLRTSIRVLMAKYKMLGLAAKYGLSDVIKGLSILLGIRYGQVLYREFSGSVLLCLRLGPFHCCLCVLHVHCLYVSACCTLCIFNK